MKRLLPTALALLLTLTLHAQKFEGLALTPPMGWNSWNTFATAIDEELIRQTADEIVSSGLRDAGYEYLVLDDGWMAMERDENGRLQGDPKRFPGGMKALGDYIHSKGLKFGIYSCAGYKTCGGYPASRGYEYIDAKTFAEWGVDYLKYDWCNTEKLNAEGAYLTMREALYAAGRPIVFSICEWGDNKPWEWAAGIGHLWRATGDIINCWDCEIGHGSWTSMGVWKVIDKREDLRKYAGPDHWNDYDMMEVGNGLTDAENRSHFAMWCMLSSPLIMGNDIRSMSEETRHTLSNKEVIAINQDSLGVQGFRFSNEGEMEIWAKPLTGGDWAMAFVNMDDKTVRFEFDWTRHGIHDHLKGKTLEAASTYRIRDLYSQEWIGDTSTHLKAKIAEHDVLLVRLSRTEH